MVETTKLPTAKKNHRFDPIALPVLKKTEQNGVRSATVSWK
jgi:hypothetical protein